MVVEAQVQKTILTYTEKQIKITVLNVWVFFRLEGICDVISIMVQHWDTLSSLQKIARPQAKKMVQQENTDIL